MIYLDNAATSFPKPKCVIDKLIYCIEKASGNPGRSSHALSLAAAEEIYNTRERLAAHFNFPYPENIIFTYNATYAINMALHAFLRSGDHVLISDMEHNAVIRPLELLRKSKGIDFSCFSTRESIDDSIAKGLRKNTRAIVSTLASNVTGKRISLDVLSKAARDAGILLITDASQAAGHEKIDLIKTPCDCLCAPAHKGLFGIQGAGFAIFSSAESIEPLIVGGSGTNSREPFMPPFLPEMMEAGTPSTPSIAALGEGIKFVDDIGLHHIAKKERTLSDMAKAILAESPRLELYDSFGGTVLFNIKGATESTVCRALDDREICVRGGLHCAPSAHRVLGTESTGAVRASFSCLNTLAEAEYFAKEVCKIAAEI